MQLNAYLYLDIDNLTYIHTFCTILYYSNSSVAISFLFVVPRNVEIPSIDSRGQSYITLKWTNPNSTRRYVGVTYGKSSSQAIVKVNQDAHTQIAGLKANSAYTFNIYTRSGNHNSTRTTISINTSEYFTSVVTVL